MSLLNVLDCARSETPIPPPALDAPTAPFLSDESAADVLRLLAQAPVYDLMRSRYSWDFPEYLRGTPTGDLLESIDTAAEAAGLFLQREWNYRSWGGFPTYTVEHRNREIARVEMKSAEGKTPRSQAYKQFEELHQLVTETAAALVQSGMAATLRMPGDYFMQGGPDREVLELGGFYNRKTFAWYSPPATLAQIEAIMRPWAAVNLNFPHVLTHEQKAVVYPIVGSYGIVCIPTHTGQPPLCFYILAKHEPAVRATLNALSS